MKKWLNKKVIYLVAIIVIICGMLTTFIWKTNFSLEYKEHADIHINFDKVYEINEVKALLKEVLGNRKMVLQKVETFNDSILVNVEAISDDEVTSLENAIREKYEIEEETTVVEVTQVGHVSFRDIIKPYIIPMALATILIAVYFAIRYSKLGIFKVVFVLFLRIIVAEGAYLGILEITRIPLGSYFVPVAIGLYVAIILFTTICNEKLLVNKSK